MELSTEIITTAIVSSVFSSGFIGAIVLYAFDSRIKELSKKELENHIKTHCNLHREYGKERFDELKTEIKELRLSVEKIAERIFNLMQG